MPRPSDSYGDISSSFDLHSKYIHDAIYLFDAKEEKEVEVKEEEVRKEKVKEEEVTKEKVKVDFTKYDIVYIAAPPNAKQNLFNSPTWHPHIGASSLSPSFSLHSSSSFSHCFA